MTFRLRYHTMSPVLQSRPRAPRAALGAQRSAAAGLGGEPARAEDEAAGERHEDNGAYEHAYHQARDRVQRVTDRRGLYDAHDRVADQATAEEGGGDDGAGAE